MKPENFFSTKNETKSHAIKISAKSFTYSTLSEQAGLLVYCLYGELELSGHNGTWKIPQNHMVYIPKQRAFRVRAQNFFEAIVVKFYNDEVAWRKAGCWVALVKSFAAYMIDYSLKWANPSDENLNQAACFFITLGEMLPRWFLNERIMWTSKAQTPLAECILNYIRKKGTAVTLLELSEHIHMSERTLRRHILSDFGQNWRGFIQEVRMNLAMDMLRKDNSSVTETAFKVGYSDSSSFSNAFSKYVGKTPSDYAKSFTDSRNF